MSVRIYPKNGITGQVVRYNDTADGKIDREFININFEYLAVGDSQEEDRVFFFIDPDDPDEGGLSFSLTCDEAELLAVQIMQQVKKYRPK